MILSEKKIDLNNRHMFTALSITAVLTIWLTIFTGGIVRLSEVGQACGDWPMCLGSLYPPVETNALIDYIHRLASVLIFPVLVLVKLFNRKLTPAQAFVRPLVNLSLSIWSIQVLLGYFIATSPQTFLNGWLPVIHSLISLMLLALMTVVLTLSFYRRSGMRDTPQITFASRFGKTSLIFIITVFLLLISGSYASQHPLGSSCNNWPLCDGFALPGDLSGWISMIHRFLVLFSGAWVILASIRAWRSQRSNTVVLVTTTVVATLFFSQALLAAKMISGFPLHIIALHQATAVAVWIAVVVQSIVVGIENRTEKNQANEIAQPSSRIGFWKDLLLLTKPIVVILLLVTTFTGMVIANRDWPGQKVLIWTMLAGFMAAGGSGAINQYIDREDDSKMQRTRKRPIPSGRLTPGEGLAFGVAMAISSFYLMTAFVNLLAALLLLVGIVYYVLIYSIFLKKTSVQNIVIGGGAGAIPPLVGWAAVTGSLNIPALFLFAIVFMWTPPHFWALALVRRNDYARAGVPMLPVVRGEKETRWQILLYTIALVLLTLILPAVGLGGTLYLFFAIVFGIWLIMAAWRVWKLGGNKLAWKMYRYSSMYLAFLFIALMVDRLLI